MRDTAARRLVMALAVSWLVAAPAGAAEPPLRVLWAGAQRVYVGIEPGAAVREGDRVTFFDRRKEVGSGEVEQVAFGELAIVSLRSGTLERRRWNRLRVVLEPPLVPRSMRLGVPSSERSNLLFACPTLALQSPEGAPDYRVERIARRSWRLTRPVPEAQPSEPGAATGASPWPDTLLAVEFDDAADEEIALERGEIDVALFWPGERSPHVRDDPRWREAPLGERRRGVVVLVTHRAVDSIPEALDAGRWDLFNDDLFGGDLRRLAPSSRWPNDRHPRRIEPDRELPGQARLQHWLDRVPGPTPRSSSLRLAYHDASPDSSTPPGTVALFAIRCPIVVPAPWRRAVEAMGPDALASILACPPRRGPR